MTQTDTDPAFPASEVVKIVSFGGNLYTETGRPLYRYYPLAQMSQQGMVVPWASEWDAYIALWIHTYVPFPRTTSNTPAIAHGGLNYQDRTGAGPGRAYQQATYRGWPLYTCDQDTANFNLAPQGTVPGLFEMVSIAEPAVSWPSSKAVSQPPPESVDQREDSAPNVGWPSYLSGP